MANILYLNREEADELRRRLWEDDQAVRTLRDRVRGLELALKKARRAPPAVEMAELLDQLAACPLCGAGGPWRRRECCELGRLVGQVEGKSVADALMDGEEGA